jgi:hypothetical protein
MTGHMLLHEMREALQVRTERDSYRALACAALDQLHAANVEIERQRRMICEMREERERYARAVFGEQA